MLEHSFGLTPGMLTRDFGALTTALYFVLLQYAAHGIPGVVQAPPGAARKLLHS